MKTTATVLTRCIAATAALCLTSLTLSYAAPVYKVAEIGVLTGNVSSIATSLNDRGEVVGYCAPAVEDFNQTGFIWRNGTLTNVGKLPKGLYSFTSSINNLGVAVGDGDTGNIRPQSWMRGTDGKLVNIFPNNGGNTHAIGINDTGAICGFYTKSLSGWMSSWKAAIWTQDKKDPRKFNTVVLPVIPSADPLSPSTCAIPSAFNQAGQAVGYAANEEIGQHACLWNSDAAHTIVDLHKSEGDGSSIALGLNGYGQVVGQSHPPFGSRPVLWDNDAAHTEYQLELLPGQNYGSGYAINNNGHIIGWGATSEVGTWNVGPGRFVLWRDGGVFDLESLLDPLTGAGWTILSVNAINSTGQIAGTGKHNGVTRAFLLTPTAP